MTGVDLARYTLCAHARNFPTFRDFRTTCGYLCLLFYVTIVYSLICGIRSRRWLKSSSELWRGEHCKTHWLAFEKCLDLVQRVLVVPAGVCTSQCMEAGRLSHERSLPVDFQFLLEVCEGYFQH